MGCWGNDDHLKKPEAKDFLTENHPDLNRQMEMIASGHHGAYVNARTAAINHGNTELVEKMDKLYKQSDLSSPAGFGGIPGMGLLKATIFTAAAIDFGKDLTGMINQNQGFANYMQTDFPYANDFMAQQQNTSLAENNFESAMSSLNQFMSPQAGPDMGMGMGMGMNNMGMSNPLTQSAFRMG